jgi:hypothetical protein
LNNAHHILGIDKNASTDEVKKAYRKLAKRYHPDVASPSDSKKFQEVKSAYEYLMKPQPLLLEYKVASRTVNEEKEARLKEARIRFKEQQYKEHIDELNYFTSQTTGVRRRLFNWILAVSLVLNVLLVVDFIVPGQWQKADVVEMNKTKEFGGLKYRKVYPIRVDGAELFISSKQANKLSHFGYLSIEESLILRIKKRIAVRDGSSYWMQSPGFSYTGSFPLINILLLIPLVARLLLKKKNIAFFLMYRASLYGIPLLGLVILLFYL